MTEQGKSLTNKDGSFTKLTEWATADVQSVEDAIALFGDQGVSYSTGQEITGDYKLITKDEKQAFLKRVAGVKTFVVRWQFNNGDVGEFASVYCVIDGFGKYIINDGSKGGMYGQLSKITSTRIEQGITDGREKAGVLAERGFKMNNIFFYDDRTGKALNRTQLETLSDENCDCKKVEKKHTGEAHKKQANPTWRLEF
jgi:hypothetical protein